MSNKTSRKSFKELPSWFLATSNMIYRHLKYTGKLLPKRSKMTCIIAAKCTNGVALIGDRKIVNYDNSVDFKDKLFMVCYPIVVGLAGETLQFEDVKREALEVAQKSLKMQKAKQK
jgi:20S proteasome alpha/beta subunit